jgi:lactoylglutathione lyase
MRVSMFAIGLGLGALATPTAGAQPQPAPGPLVVADHIALHVADPAASAAFYTRLFGFAPLPVANPNVRWLAIGVGLELHLIGGRTAPVATPREVHLAFRSAGLEPIIRGLDAAGVVWTDWAGKPATINVGRRDGVRQVFFTDPDGYLVEVNDAAAPEQAARR